MLICQNGEFLAKEAATLSINDGAFLFGDSLFETLKAQGQKILLIDEHLERLELSAKLLNFPCDRKRIERSLQQLAARLTAATSRIRLTISRGSRQGLALPEAEQSWFLLTATPMTEINDEQRRAGTVCVIAANQRVNPLNHLPQMKRGNYTDCLYAGDFARQKGAEEALFIDAQGNLLEGNTSNIFAVIGNRLITPPTGSLILAGVMRRQVINAAEESGLSIVEQPLPLTDLQHADEIFLTNSLIDILPVSSLDGHATNRGPRWKSLMKTLQKQIEA